ncbi:MAG: hypothetical protein AB7F86_13105 [Bdellovibrionales bacterium]
MGLRKLLLLGFFAFNLLAITISNRTDWFPNSSVIYYIRMYSYWTGLDARWEMFSYMYRDDWRLIFKARLKGQHEDTVLPLALQSKRTFMDQWFFDFKDAKIRLNLYNQTEARAIYEKYLCRTFAKLYEQPIDYIACDLESVKILPPHLARTIGKTKLGRITTTRFDVTKCDLMP